MHTQAQNKGRKGFTLIEVMVVTVIMGILAAVAVPNIYGLVEKSKEKVDLLKLFYLRDAMNKALIENDNALYNTAYAQSNSHKLDSLLGAGSGVALFVIEMKKTASVNVQAEHGSANNSANMCQLIGNAGTWFDALTEARFDGVADIVKFRLDTKDNTGIKNDINQNGKAHDTFTIKEDGSNYRTYPKTPMFISRALNNGKDADLNKITSQSNKTNYRLTMSIQWSGADPNSHSVEVALLPNGAKMFDKSNGKGGAFLSDHGVCFSTYGDKGCANYRY